MIHSSYYVRLVGSAMLRRSSSFIDRKSTETGRIANFNSINVRYAMCYMNINCRSGLLFHIKLTVITRMPFSYADMKSNWRHEQRSRRVHRAIKMSMNDDPSGGVNSIRKCVHKVCAKMPPRVLPNDIRYPVVNPLISFLLSIQLVFFVISNCWRGIFCKTMLFIRNFSKIFYYWIIPKTLYHFDHFWI